MGCDIHLVVEHKWNGKWVGMHAFPSMRRLQRHNGEVELMDNGYPKYDYNWWTAENRNYALFAEVAGVRGDGPDPLGMPDDASDLAQMVLGEDVDLHSHTWMPLREALGVWMKHYARNLLPAMLDAEKKEHMVYVMADALFGVDVEDGNCRIDNYRLVIAFDS